MRAATASLHSVAYEGEDEPRETEQPAPAGPGPRTTLRFEADPTRPATITTEAKGRAADPDGRMHLERELDRLQSGVSAEQTTFAQQLNWLLLSQGLLLNAYVMLLVFGWSAPLPGRRLLLAGVAVAAATVATFIYVALRGTRGGLRTLVQRRQDIEKRLEKEYGRAPTYDTARAGLALGLGRAATRFLPATFIAGWTALTLYTLGLPPGVTAADDARAAGAPPAQVRAPARNGTQAAPTETPQAQPARRFQFRP